MPNHVHLIAFDKSFDNARLQQTLTDFRKFTGRILADYIDMNLPDSLKKVIRTTSVTDRVRRVWQSGWHAEGLISESFWEQKMDYIHENPVRKGYVRLPEHWRPA
jgi:putative transposase